jgi:hypothetical protein
MSRRKSQGFHTRKPKSAPISQEHGTPEAAAAPHDTSCEPGLSPTSPETGNPEPQTARETRYNALRHGAFAASLDATAAAVGEDPAEARELLDELQERYDPADAVERLLVERLMETWRRLLRFSRHGEAHLRECIACGTPVFRALQEREASGREEARLERSLLHLHKHLEFLQRWRSGAARREVADSLRASDLEAQLFFARGQADARREAAEGLARFRARQAAEAAAADPAPGETQEQSAALPDVPAGNPPRDADLRETLFPADGSGTEPGALFPHGGRSPEVFGDSTSPMISGA